jgi:hypothetical protein
LVSLPLFTFNHFLALPRQSKSAGNREDRRKRRAEGVEEMWGFGGRQWRILFPFRRPGSTLGQHRVQSSLQCFGHEF